MTAAGLNSLLDQFAPVRRRKRRFLFALGLVVAALAFAAATQILFRSPATLIFAAAVIACTGLFGLTAGLLCAAAAVLTLDFFFVSPAFQFNMDIATLRVAIELAALAICNHFIERRVSGKIRSKIKVPLGIRGQLDGMLDGQVYGWAMDCDNPSSPVLVTIFVDSRPVAEIAAVYYRPDLQTRLHSSGSHGFYVDLSARASIQKEALVEARASNGQLLENSPQKMMLSVRAPQNGPAVLFMHIAKTAGSAFREAITANYRESAVAYLYGTAPGFLVGDLRRLPLEQRRDLRLVIGRFQYGLHHDLPQESLYVTIVREPAARVLSQYAYLQQTQPDLLREGNRILRLEELLERKLHLHFDSTLVRHFAGVDEREFPAGSVNDEVYEAALNCLRTGFTFVGHQKFAADAYAWLRRRFGWSARAELEIVNAGLIPVDRAERATARQAMEKYNYWDCRLYEEILRIFPYSYAG